MTSPRGCTTCTSAASCISTSRAVRRGAAQQGRQGSWNGVDAGGVGGAAPMGLFTCLRACCARGWRVLPCVLSLGCAVQLLTIRRAMPTPAACLCPAPVPAANILLSRHGTAKICDIGMARVLGNKNYLSMLSGMGTFAWRCVLLRAAVRAASCCRAELHGAKVLGNSGRAGADTQSGNTLLAEQGRPACVGASAGAVPAAPPAA